MLEQLKKKTFKSSIVWSVILLLGGLFLVVFAAQDVLALVFGYTQFEELEPDEIKPHKLVEINLDANFGCYLEEYEYNSDTRVSKTTDLYYVIWTGDEYAIDFRYMTIKVAPSYEAELEEMADNTFQNYYSDSITFYGKIKKLGDEEYDYFKEYFEASDWTAEEIEEGTLPYYIDCYANKNSMAVVFVILFVVGVLLIAIAVIRFIKGVQGGFLKKLRKDIEASGYSEATIESDYSHATSYEKKENIKIGRLMIYHLFDVSVRAFPVKKLVWAYQNTVTHRTNGIKTGTTYQVVLYIDGEKNAHTMPVSNEAVALEILKKINETFPWVVVGYSDDIKKMYNKNYAEFLNLRYNTCEHVVEEPGFEGYSTGFGSDYGQI